MTIKVTNKTVSEIDRQYKYRTLLTVRRLVACIEIFFQQVTLNFMQRIALRAKKPYIEGLQLHIEDSLFKPDNKLLVTCY